MEQSAGEHQHRAHENPAMQERRDRQHAETERELTRMEIAFERIRPGLRDGVTQRQRRRERHRRPRDTVEQRADAASRPRAAARASSRTAWRTAPAVRDRVTRDSAAMTSSIIVRRAWEAMSALSRGKSDGSSCSRAAGI